MIKKKFYILFKIINKILLNKMSITSIEDYNIISLDRQTSAIKIQYYFRKYLNDRNKCLSNINKFIYDYTGINNELDQYISQKNIYKIFKHVNNWKNGYIILLSYIMLFLIIVNN